jgi:hypothetical protein
LRLALGLSFLVGATSLCQAGGTVVAWGANDSLQSQVPAGLTNVPMVAGGEAHSLALKSDGTVVGWGFNVAGQANVPSNLTSVVAISAGVSYSLALLNDGTVHTWGLASNPPVGLSNVAAIAAGWTHALALKHDGTVVTWGSQTNLPDGLNNVIAIAAGDGQSLALLANGTVMAWGDDTYNKAEVPAGLTNVLAVAAGADHCLAMRRDGSLVAWGRNDKGQATVPASLTNAVAVAAGALHSVALRADGTLISWGDNTFGQVTSTPASNNVIAVAAGGYHNLALIGDGSPVIFVQPASQSVLVSRSATFQVVAGGAPPLSYQWQFNGTNLAGATRTSLALNNVQVSDGGPYTVVVTNLFGSVTSVPAILTPVGIPPFVTVAPQDTNVICGDAASFQVTVDGSTPFSYQWEFEGTPLAGATRSRLVLTNVNSTQAGFYSVVVTNAFGSVTTGAVLTVTVVPPHIISSLTNSGTQGLPFSYTISAQHTPISFAARFLPAGLTLNTTNGVISGVPLESGTFGVVITAANACTNESQLMVLTIDSAVPVLTSALAVTNGEALPFSYQITASGAPTNFGALDLPDGLTVDAYSGLISGAASFAGDYDSTIWASNYWGAATGTLHISITNGAIQGLSIADVTYTYSKPYLLDFSFSLRDNNDPTQGNPIFADARLLSAICLEDDETNSPTETGSFIARTSSKVVKAYLVLDFTESIASLRNGDTNGDGISDAVDAMVNGAIGFVNEQAVGTQIGVFEFHRDDMAPNQVLALTPDKNLVDQAIAGIWTNYVQGFPAGSRCWDAAAAAITALGAKNTDEYHYVILISDGKDESSTNTLVNVVTAATNNNVIFYCVGFGAELDPPVLQGLASQTQGRYYTAQTSADITTQLAQVSKEAMGKYVLRWATLKRLNIPFMPSFQVSYQGLTANSPTNPFTLAQTNIDNSTTPPTTNITPASTNFIIGYYYPGSNAGPVTVGSLRLVPNAEVLPSAVDLRATYIPRYIRQMRFRYRPNWPCTPVLQATNVGEMFYGWTMTLTNLGGGTNSLFLTSPYPVSLTNSLPFASFGKIVTFNFQDVINPTNAFSLFAVDNTLYTNTGGQSFVFATTNLMVYPVLPFGTPVPWLIALGYTNTNSWVQAELNDDDGDGMPNWKEYRANTNPTNAVSVFTIRSVVRQPDGRSQITFSTANNRVYRLESSTDLLNWQTVQDNIPGVNQDLTLTDTRFQPGVTSLYYRVKVY